VVPVVLSEADPEAKLYSLKSSQGRRNKEQSKTFDGTWKLKPFDLEEWKSWLFLQQVERDVKSENFFIQVRPPEMASPSNPSSSKCLSVTKIRMLSHGILFHRLILYRRRGDVCTQHIVMHH
jgi:hypothetical protein